MEIGDSQPGSGYSAEVIDGCRRGVRHCLEQVFRRESSYISRVLFRVVGPSSDLEDLLQLTMEQAIVAFANFRGEAAVRTWLTRIAVRTAMHHLKNPAQKRRVSLTLVEGGTTELSSSRPHDEVDARERVRLLYEHLEKIEPKQRTAFLLFQVEGRSMEEVAALMDSGLSATKSRVMWARRKLLARLQKDERMRDLCENLEEFSS